KNTANQPTPKGLLMVGRICHWGLLAGIGHNSRSNESFLPLSVQYDRKEETKYGRGERRHCGCGAAAADRATGERLPGRTGLSRRNGRCRDPQTVYPKITAPRLPDLCR